MERGGWCVRGEKSSRTGFSPRDWDLHRTTHQKEDLGVLIKQAQGVQDPIKPCFARGGAKADRAEGSGGGEEGHVSLSQHARRPGVHVSRKGTFGVRGSSSRSARLHDSRAGTPESRTSWVRFAICETVAGEGRPRRGEGSRPRDHADPRSAAVSRAEEEEGLTSLRETSCVRARCSLVEDRRRVAAIRTEATPKTKKRESAGACLLVSASALFARRESTREPAQSPGEPSAILRLGGVSVFPLGVLPKCSRRPCRLPNPLTDF